MKGILGKKVGMTQIFDEKGEIVPVTVIEAGPCYVTQIKSADKDGYKAVQLGFGDVQEKRISRGERGHLGLLKTDEKHPKRRALQNVPAVRHLREFRIKGDEGLHRRPKDHGGYFRGGRARGRDRHVQGQGLCRRREAASLFRRPAHARPVRPPALARLDCADDVARQGSQGQAHGRAHGRASA